MTQTANQSFIKLLHDDANANRLRGFMHEEMTARIHELETGLNRNLTYTPAMEYFDMRDLIDELEIDAAYAS